MIAIEPCFAAAGWLEWLAHNLAAAGQRASHVGHWLLGREPLISTYATAYARRDNLLPRLDGASFRTRMMILGHSGDDDLEAALAVLDPRTVAVDLVPAPLPVHQARPDHLLRSLLLFLQGLDLGV